MDGRFGRLWSEIILHTHGFRAPYGTNIHFIIDEIVKIHIPSVCGSWAMWMCRIRFWLQLQVAVKHWAVNPLCERWVALTGVCALYGCSMLFNSSYPLVKRSIAVISLQVVLTLTSRSISPLLWDQTGSDWYVFLYGFSWFSKVWNGENMEWSIAVQVCLTSPLWGRASSDWCVASMAFQCFSMVQLVKSGEKMNWCSSSISPLVWGRSRSDWCVAARWRAVQWVSLRATGGM